MAFFFFRGATKAISVPASKRDSPVMVTIAKSGAKPPRSTSPKRVTRKSTSPRDLLKLGPSFGLSPKVGESSLPPATHLDGGKLSGDDAPRDGYETSNAMTIEQEAKLYPHFSALWRKVNASMGYPDDFVKERVTGYVTVQLEVDGQGVFTGKIAGVNSDQPLLEAYALGVLFHALSEPLPQSLWSGQGPTIMVMRFDFKTITYGEVSPPRIQAGLKNVLEFARFGYVDPKLKETIEKLMVRYVPPILPVPGGAYIDFIRVYQMVRNWRSRHHINADGLRAERMELRREQWRSMIRRPEDGAQAVSRSEALINK